MDKRDEKLLEQAHNARLVHMNEQLVFPLLRRNIDSAVNQLCNEMKAKGTVSLSIVAYIAACKDLASELEAIARLGDRAVVKLEIKP